MGSRLEFNKKLLTIAKNVYFQQPSDVNIEYPCIVYGIKSIDKLSADDEVYNTNMSYTVTVIDRNPDSKIVDAILDFKYCKFDRHFVSGGLNHSVFNIYY